MISKQYADDFFEISEVLATNQTLRGKVLQLVAVEAIPAKVLEGGNRLDLFRLVLKDVAAGVLTLDQAYARTEQDIPRLSSPHGHDNRVFASGWGERLVRTQLSRVYNQAVLEQLLQSGAVHCFVPHSAREDSTSSCSVHLAGTIQDVQVLYDRLIEAYRDGKFTKDLKIPNHPHCTHTVVPMP